MSIATIHPKELAQLCIDDESIHLVDVRTPVEYLGLHANGATNHPLDQLDPNAIMQARNGSDKPVYLICQMGGRSMQACEQLVAHGFSNVVNVEGGTMLWAQQGLPVVRGQKQLMAIDRQVRIAAGSLVLVGGLLALVLQPAWIGVALAAFVGAGLVHSGVTNTCGMASVLLKMPWNHVKKSGDC